MNEKLKIYDEKMQKTIHALDTELASIRAGRANPNILNKLTVEYYGTPTPIQQVANISVPEARMIQIQPWEKKIIKDIEKAILMSDIGINPTNDGTVVRLMFPELTEERRKELVKDVKKKGEAAKVAIRNIRRDGNDAFKKLKKAPVNFVGNVEAREVPRGACDVIVCDGFVGNVILKLTEGVAMSILELVKSKLMASIKSKMAALMLKPQLKSLKKEFDYEEYGGAPILGVDGPVLKIHGSSTANAVRNAIIKSVPYSKENVVEIIRQSMLELEEVIEKVEEEYSINE